MTVAAAAGQYRLSGFTPSVASAVVQFDAMASCAALSRTCQTSGGAGGAEFSHVHPLDGGT